MQSHADLDLTWTLDWLDLHIIGYVGKLPCCNLLDYCLVTRVLHILMEYIAISLVEKVSVCLNGNGHPSSYLVMITND